MIRDPMQMCRDVVRQESAAGLILMVVAAAGLLVANSPLAPHDFAIQKVSIGLTLRYWINDALMAAFFLLVGPEIRREMLERALASWRERALFYSDELRLPALAAAAAVKPGSAARCYSPGVLACAIGPKGRPLIDPRTTSGSRMARRAPGNARRRDWLPFASHPEDT